MKSGLAWIFLGLVFLHAAENTGSRAQIQKAPGGKSQAAGERADPSPQVVYEADANGKRLVFDFSIQPKSISDPDMLFSHFISRPLVIFYFSVKCMHCHHALPYILKLGKELESIGISTIAIAVKNNSEDDIRSFIRKNNMSFPVFLDHDMSFSSLYGTGRIPLVIAVNAMGEFIRFRAFNGDETPLQIKRLFSDSEFGR